MIKDEELRLFRFWVKEIDTTELVDTLTRMIINLSDLRVLVKEVPKVILEKISILQEEVRHRIHDEKIIAGSSLIG